MKAIVAKNLTKYYGNLLAVDRINFSVKKGEVFGFLGPNGAGKTTTVRMLSGLTKISEGNAYVNGFSPLENPKELKKSIGVVPDISNLYLELTAWQNLMFIVEMYELPKNERERRVKELLQFFGLENKRNAKFKDLSKGQKRKLTIAASLVHKPKVLFLDEPTIGLDVMSRRSIWQLIKRLNKEGELTIFLTTHNIHEAFQVSDRIAIINKGRIVEMGTPSNLKLKFSESEIIEVAFSKRVKKSTLSKIKGISKIEKNANIFKLLVRDSTNVLESLAKVAKQMKANITYLNLRGADAEEIFLKIIGDKDVGGS
ncbi:MAG: ABC transporter ATP-binding protein [Candidatus Aenigmarchaeota archaeon]|nr:ABC transporter ATP-binding protein [Candidatus Aenigmarchaeota archaeon]